MMFRIHKINLQLLLLIFMNVVLILTIGKEFCFGKRFNRCELAGQLYILDIAKDDLPLWLCIAQYESRFNTHVIGQRNQDGSKDYGIFQISDKFWCLPENETDYYNFNECNLNCTELIKDDITASVQCAKQIQKRQGWVAWTVYEEFCNDSTLIGNDIETCFQNHQSVLDTTDKADMGLEEEQPGPDSEADFELETEPDFDYLSNNEDEDENATNEISQDDENFIAINDNEVDSVNTAKEQYDNETVNLEDMETVKNLRNYSEELGL